MKKLTTQESNYTIDRLMELMDTEVGKKYTDELLIAMLCIQIANLQLTCNRLKREEKL